MLARLTIGVLMSLVLCVDAAAGQAENSDAGKKYELKGLSATVSPPRLVARRKGHCWFPSLLRLDNGDLLAQAQTTGDDFKYPNPGVYMWSSDGGLTWTAPAEINYIGDAHLRLPSGDELLLPYYMKALPNGGMGAPCNVIPKGKRQVVPLESGVSVNGLRSDKPFSSQAQQIGITGFVFNGQTLAQKDGGYLAMVYGRFQDAAIDSLVVVESKDGIKWAVRSIVFDGKNGPLPAMSEGANECSICRLKDGRLMCIFRMGGYAYGQCWSPDEGRTWTAPARMKNDAAGNVQPALLVLKNGVVVLAGGRPGVNLWFNLDGGGNEWQKLDLLAHHNAALPAFPIKLHEGQNYGHGRATGYTDVVALDDSHLMFIYDRTSTVWPPKHDAANELDMDSVWVVKVELK